MEEYLEQLRQVSTKEDLDLNRQNMENYLSGIIQIRTMQLLLKKEVKTGSKSLYLDVMEARVYFEPDTIMQFGDFITQYQAWHRYLIENHQVEVVELDYSQTQASRYLVLLGFLWGYFVLYGYECKM